MLGNVEASKVLDVELLTLSNMSTFKNEHDNFDYLKTDAGIKYCKGDLLGYLTGKNKKIAIEEKKNEDIDSASQYLLTPIISDTQELEQLVKTALNRHETTVEVSGVYSTEFINNFMEHINNGFIPKPDTARELGGYIYMDKPKELLETEYENITLAVTKEYQADINRQELKRKKALKAEQEKIKEAKRKQVVEEQILNSEI